MWGLTRPRAPQGAECGPEQGPVAVCCWGKTGGTGVGGNVKELSSGGVSGVPGGYPVEILDRRLDPEVWDSPRRRPPESRQNTGDL